VSVLDPPAGWHAASSSVVTSSWQAVAASSSKTAVDTEALAGLRSPAANHGT
jgi:hypothetical protein